MGIRLTTLATVSILAMLVACRSTTRSTTVALDGGAEAAPKSTGQFINAAGELGVVVAVTKASLMLNEEVVLAVPPRDEAAATGFASKHKATSPSGTIVVPLAERVRKDREKQKTEGPTYDKAVIVADASTPYRILTEVLTTLANEGVTSYQFIVRTEKDSGLDTRTAAALPPDATFHEGPALSLSVKLTVDGVLFGNRRGVIVPGCKRVPRIRGLHDLDGVRRCAHQMKKHAKQDTAVTIEASGATPFAEIMEVFDAIRTDGNAELFPTATFAQPQ